MEKSRFFLELDQVIGSILSKKPTFGFLCKKLKNNEIPLKQDYDSQKVIVRLEELKVLLDKIGAIILHPHQITTRKEVIVRSEISTALSNESFQKTMKDSSLWRDKDGQMEPMRVYSTEKDDTIVIYENKFICLLLKQLDDEVKQIKKSGLFVARPLSDYNNGKTLNLNEFSFISHFKPFASPYVMQLSLVNENSKELTDLCEKVYHKIRAYMSTDFFKTVSKYPIERYVSPTNILIHDNLYNYCYRFYKTNYLSNKQEETEINIAYYNYALLTLLERVPEIDETGSCLKMNTPISLDEKGRLRFKGLIVSNSWFDYQIKEDENDLGFSIKTTFTDKGKEESASYYILTSYSYSKFNKEEIEKKLIKKAEKYDDVFLLCMDNTIEDYDHILTLSYYLGNSSILWDNLFTYMTMLYVYTGDVFETRCPSCGGQVVQAYDNNHRHCPDCKSDYVLEERNNLKMIWMKALWRKY